MRGFRSSVAILVVAVALLLVLGIAWEAISTGHYQLPCTPTSGGTPMMPWMFRGGGMWVFPVIGLVVFLFVVYFVFTRVFSGGRPFSGWGGQGRGNLGPQSPLEILKTRYAKGEINREEFERMKKDILDDGGR